MNQEQAIALMQKMSQDGQTHEEIAAELKKRGFKGPRSGKPLASTQIGYYLRKILPGPTKGNGIAATTPNMTPEARIAIVVKILQDESWTPEQRCLVASTLLRSQG